MDTGKTGIWGLGNKQVKFPQSPTSFADYQSIEDTMEESISLENTADLGRIRLCLQRVNLTRLQIERSGQDMVHDLISEVPEKVLKGKAIANAIK